MIGDLTVILIVIAAIIIVGRRIYRAFSKDSAQCGCSSGDNCSGCTVSDPSNCNEEKNSVNSKENRSI